MIHPLPRHVPFAVAPVSIVTSAGKFFRAYLRDLGIRLAKPENYAAPPLADILGKLADAGLELAIGELVCREVANVRGSILADERRANTAGGEQVLPTGPGTRLDRTDRAAQRE